MKGTDTAVNMPQMHDCTMTMHLHTLNDMSQQLLQRYISDSLKGKDAGDVEQANRHLRKAHAILKQYTKK